MAEELYYLRSEDKGANQLCGYRLADLHLCFPICQKAGFLMTLIIYNVNVSIQSTVLS